MFCFHFAMTFLSVRSVSTLSPPLQKPCSPASVHHCYSSVIPTQLLILNKSHSPSLLEVIKIKIYNKNLPWHQQLKHHHSEEWNPLRFSRIFFLWSLKNLDLYMQVKQTELKQIQNIYYVTNCPTKILAKSIGYTGRENFPLSFNDAYSPSNQPTKWGFYTQNITHAFSFTLT